MVFLCATELWGNNHLPVSLFRMGQEGIFVCVHTHSTCIPILGLEPDTTLSMAVAVATQIWAEKQPEPPKR